MKIRDYQKHAVDNIITFLHSDNNKAKIYLSVGLGKSDILAYASKKIIEENRSVAILFLTRRECEQLRNKLLLLLETENLCCCIDEFHQGKIHISTYSDMFSNLNNFEVADIIFCDEGLFHYEEQFALLKNNIKFLAILNNYEKSNGWFEDSEEIFKYTTHEAIQEGYINKVYEDAFIEVICELLVEQQYVSLESDKQIKIRNKILRPDIVAKKNNTSYLFEVKLYRGLNNSRVLINNAIKQILEYRYLLSDNEMYVDLQCVLIMACKVDNEIKKEIFSRYNIIIWDISNLVFLCNNNLKLLELLSNTLAFSINEFESEEPLSKFAEIVNTNLYQENISQSEQFQEKLLKCATGKIDKADKSYEEICTEIIMYLFDEEFLKKSAQHKTADTMFRMDLLCSLKGTTEFWKFLMNFYNTKFVVFEYKNYSDYIPQNLIYITEKYLYPVALRNVAFIISRKGFDENAKKAALGCLRENGKLIISLDDNDLIKMTSMKENGEEPSDYLLDKVENILMSVSK